MIRAARFVAVLGFALSFSLGAPAVQAAWSAQGTGPAAAAAATMPAGAQPAGSVTGVSVTIRWAAVSMSNGTAVAGYTVQRFNAVNGTAATVGAGCTGVITTTTCTELAVPSGSWVYTDTPVQANWTGAQSPASATITVP